MSHYKGELSHFKIRLSYEHFSKYLDFIEYLVANGIVKDIDFFDMKIYKDEIERLDPTDQEEIDPQDFEKKKDTFSLFEEEVETVEKDNTEEMDVWEGLEEDWEEFNLRNKKGHSIEGN